MTPDKCPECNCDLQGAAIPENIAHYYSDHTTHYSRVISYELPGVYDGGLLWLCPDCGHAWPRFANGLLHDEGMEQAFRMNSLRDFYSNLLKESKCIV